MHVISLPHFRRMRGVTVIEQLLALAVLAILACIALPQVGPTLSQHRLLSAQMGLIAGLNATRELAVVQGARSIFCPTFDGQSCDDSTDWSSGWLLGLDQNHDGQPDQGPLQTNRIRDGSLAINGSAGRHQVIFQPDGRASGSNVTITICDPSHPTSALTVTVANSGRVRGAQANAAQISACPANHP